ncbi:hypothetical protein DdX_12543 [Ditylenchus destructor]|uniref:F-box domain-containing protein n=1 Tax=Ditylenchus destructor TaxID=166010 RepID=A0AAD4R0A2_9BILA|nr:hypothetical protein DdX_12543 [Ditylenchus destructor]
MNTWLLLDILKFMGRDQLESLQIVSRVLNNMIRQNFASGPYRIPRHNNIDAWLAIEFKDGMMNSSNLHLMLSTGDSDCFYFDPRTRIWNAFDDIGDPEGHFYPIQEMRPLIAEIVRIPYSVIFVTSAFTIWHIEELESISHLWSGQRFDIQYHPCDHYEISIDLMFQSSKLLRCHTLDFYDQETTQLHLYPLLYTVPCIRCQCVSSSKIVEIVRGKALYPQSNTVFRLRSQFWAVKEATRIIREDFLVSSNPYGFEVILEVFKNKKSQLEFRVENNRTKEVLQLKKKKKDYFYDPTENHFLFQRYFL